MSYETSPGWKSSSARILTRKSDEGEEVEESRQRALRFVKATASMAAESGHAELCIIDLLFQK